MEPSSFRKVSREVKGALHWGHDGGSLCTVHARMHFPAHCMHFQESSPT